MRPNENGAVTVRNREGGGDRLRKSFHGGGEETEVTVPIGSLFFFFCLQSTNEWRGMFLTKNPLRLTKKYKTDGS